MKKRTEDKRPAGTRTAGRRAQRLAAATLLASAFALLYWLAPRTAAVNAPSPPTYSSLLQETDQQIVFWSARSQSNPLRWTAGQRLAGMHMRRAKLSGEYRDYALAEQAILDAFNHAPDGAGPFFTRARLNFTLHRLDRVEEDLRAEERRVVLDDRLRSAILGLRADVAFQRGEYSAALGGYEESLQLHRSVDALCRLAHYRWKTGEFDMAEAAYDEAESMVHGRAPMLRAWFDLQRGLLDLGRGRFEAALFHYRNAERDLSHWWLVEEHIAEVLALRGDHAVARAMYSDLIARTGNPEFMSALARLVGDGKEKSDWLRRAQTEYERRLTSYREAALGHALEHAIEAGDPHAVQWAEQNHRLRPGGEAGVLLAQAYAAAADMDGARRVIEEVLLSPYETADVHATAAAIFNATGDSARARESAARARAIDPTALD